MKTFGYIVLALIIAFVGALALRGLKIISLPFWKLDKQIELNKDLIEKTYDVDNALYNYRWFKEREGQIRAFEGKIKNANSDVTNFELSAGERKEWTFEDKTEHSRLVSVKTGLLNQYEDIVEEYNSRAEQADRAVFQDELPTFINLKSF